MMNDTANMTGHFFFDVEFLRITTAIICIIIFFLGVVGNILVLIVFCSRLSRLKSFEMYLISLAAADLIASVTIPNKMFYELVGGSYENVGVIGCIIIQSVCTGSIGISCLTLVVISLNRYIVVRWPLHERQAGNFLLIGVIITTWTIGIALGFALYTVKGRVVMVPVGDVELCSMNFTSLDEFKGYGAMLFISQSGLPLISMSILYGLIIYELKKTVKHNFFRGRQHMTNNIYQRNKKSIRLLVALLVVFFICTTPEKLSYVIYTFEVKNMDPDKWHLTYILLTLLLMLNHCINPIVYAKLHTSFRRQTIKLFCNCEILKLKRIRESLPNFILRKNRKSILRGSGAIELYNCSGCTIVGKRNYKPYNEKVSNISSDDYWPNGERPSTYRTNSEIMYLKETFV